MKSESVSGGGRVCVGGIPGGSSYNFGSSPDLFQPSRATYNSHESNTSCEGSISEYVFRASLTNQMTRAESPSMSQPPKYLWLEIMRQAFPVESVPENSSITVSAPHFHFETMIVIISTFFSSSRSRLFPSPRQILPLPGNRPTWLVALVNSICSLFLPFPPPLFTLLRILVFVISNLLLFTVVYEPLEWNSLVTPGFKVNLSRSSGILQCNVFHLKLRYGPASKLFSLPVRTDYVTVRICLFHKQNCSCTEEMRPWPPFFSNSHINEPCSKYLCLRTSHNLSCICTPLVAPGMAAQYRTDQSPPPTTPAWDSQRYPIRSRTQHTIFCHCSGNHFIPSIPLRAGFRSTLVHNTILYSRARHQHITAMPKRSFYVQRAHPLRGTWAHLGRISCEYRPPVRYVSSCCTLAIYGMAITIYKGYGGRFLRNHRLAPNWIVHVAPNLLIVGSTFDFQRYGDLIW